MYDNGARSHPTTIDGESLLEAPTLRDYPSERQSPAKERSLDELDCAPVLEGDGETVHFWSHAHFRAQHRRHIDRGSIFVRSGPLSLGARQALFLNVPGHRKYLLCARVGDCSKGRVRFDIEAFTLHRSRLRALVGRAVSQAGADWETV